MEFSDTTETDDGQETTFCFVCESPNRTAARFCGRCGQPLEFVCTQCETVNPGKHHFCDICGKALSTKPSPALGGARASVPSPGASDSGFFRRIGARALNLSGKPRFIGLTWDTPIPNWEWSRSFLREWAYRNRWELLAIVLLTAVASFLRVYRLGEYPAGFHGDEAITGLEALRILQEGWVGPYTGSALGQVTGPFYLTALLVGLFDASRFTVRFSMALFGITTVPVTYFLLRLGFGRWVALLATAGLTVSYWHLHFSRLGFGVVSLAWASTLAAAALLWAMRSRSHWSWLAAGALMGLVPYTYLAFPTFIAAMTGALCFYLFLRRDRLRPALVSLGLFAIGALIVASPMIAFVVDSPDVYFSRIQQKSMLRSHEFPETGSLADKAEYIASRSWEALTLLYRNPRWDGVDGIGGKGAVDLGIAALAYIGLAVSITRWRSPPYLMAVLVVLGALAGLVISDPSAGSLRRSITAVPWIFGLAGVGAVGIAAFARRLIGESGRMVAVGVLILVMLAGGAWNLRYYFGEMTQDQNFEWAFAADHVESLDAAHTIEDPGILYFYSGRWSYQYETIRFLYPDSHGIDRSREFGDFDLTRLDDGPVTYVLMGDYAMEIDRLKQLYPGGETIIDGEPRPRFIVYHLRS